MTRARKHLVCLEETPYYHVTSRCVRRAFLCGKDAYSGRSYEHRRGWIEDRIRVLVSLFSIELCAYAVMSNHYHLVVKLNPGEAATWSDSDVLERWTTLFRGPLLVQQSRAGKRMTPAEQDTLRSMATVFRGRLASLSWFMKCLNEPIARKANAEDNCSGHFWEARFHSQPLCSEQALIAAMAYVDLNPIRAGLAETPEQSSYTSFRARIGGNRQRSDLREAIAQLTDSGELNHWNIELRPLKQFPDRSTRAPAGSRNDDDLPIYWDEYLKLVDATGRIVVRDKRGTIDPALEPVLTRLGLSAEQWLSASTAFRRNFRNGRLRLKQPA